MNILKTKYSLWLYKSKSNKEGKSPLYFRIIVGKDKAELSTGIYVSARNWDDKFNKVKDSEPDSDISNKKVDQLIESFKAVYKDLLDKKADYTPEMIKRRMLGLDVETTTLVQLFNSYLKNMNDLLGVDFKENTIQRYETTFTHIKDFLNIEKGLTDIPLNALDKTFIKTLDRYLKVVKGHKKNTAGKYITNFKTVLESAVDDGFLSKNPVDGFKVKKDIPVVNYLSQYELQQLEGKTFDIERMENIRKIFLFQCYTGLAYVDVEKLNSKEIVNINGNSWIVTSRTKNNIPVRVLIINKALEILNSFPPSTNKIFPVPSNQRFNVYLKELADACGINKNLTTHLARKTFATTVTLTQGVDIVAVSKMLGHRKLSTTQIYAEVVNLKIENEMSKIDGRFNVDSSLKAI